MAGSMRTRQKKRETKRAKRESRKKDARKLEARYQGASLLRIASSAPFGPCWVSMSLDEPASGDLPKLVTVVVTRRVRGQLVGMLLLVDRTCMGVTAACLLPLQAEASVLDFVAEVLRRKYGLRACEAIEALSVVFHALDYAASLGIVGRDDFVLPLLGSRPDALLETPLAHPDRPLYIPGPDDDVTAILRHLDAVVGEDAYDFVDGLHGVTVRELDGGAFLVSGPLPRTPENAQGTAAGFDRVLSAIRADSHPTRDTRPSIGSVTRSQMRDD